MKFKHDFFANYLKAAPVPLAIERTLECEILSKQEFSRPILDIGCGEGLFAYILFDEKIDVGIEPNALELKRAEEYGIYKELINCYGNGIPKKSSSFNTIFSNSVLEHIPELAPVLKEAHRLLTSQGKFYITVPTNLFDNYSMLFQLFSALRLNSLAEKYRIFFNKFWKHYHYYDEEGWRKLFMENGFEVVKVQKYDRKRVCLLNDMSAPFSMVSFISKKLFNKWFLFKRIRAAYVPVLNAVFSPVVKTDKASADSGLIFFCLKKA